MQNQKKLPKQKLLQKLSHRQQQLSNAAVAIFIFLLLDSLCFKTGYYNRFLEPVSAAGAFKERLLEVAYCSKTKQHWIALMGDSRMTEGISEQEFDRVAANKVGIKSIDMAMPGSSPRVWFYLLQQADKDSDIFDAIVLPLPSYNFCKLYPSGDPANRPLDLRVLLPMLSSTQLLDLANTYHDWILKGRIWFALLLRGTAFQDDVCAFISHPMRRLEAIKSQRKYAGVGDYNYQGNESSLNGFVVADNKLISAPPGAPENLKKDIELELSQQIAPGAEALERKYLKFWLNRILNKYKNSKTKIIFVRVPSNPFRAGLADGPDEVLQALATKYSNVAIVDSSAFTALEKPEYFHDFLHLDSKGRTIFSNALATQIIQILSSQSTH